MNWKSYLTVIDVGDIVFDIKYDEYGIITKIVNERFFGNWYKNYENGVLKNTTYPNSWVKLEQLKLIKKA